MKNMFFCFHSVVDSFVLKIFAKKASEREHLNVIVAEVEKKIFEIVKLEAKQQHDLIFIYAKRTWTRQTCFMLGIFETIPITYRCDTIEWVKNTRIKLKYFSKTNSACDEGGAFCLRCPTSACLSLLYRKNTRKVVPDVIHKFNLFTSTSLICLSFAR